MKEIMSNPHVGTMVSLPPLADSRWFGWRKMTNTNAHGVEIHDVEKFENGVIVAVDDFKFK
ncbi:hypothetical protein WG904_00010 [Pedobacter sp. Du54]|uniref:hypothetical protein n=1 Tax=Pedobacter anseongensis TaxID=3133439 RepID=UPI0030995913